MSGFGLPVPTDLAKMLATIGVGIPRGLQMATAIDAPVQPKAESREPLLWRLFLRH
jgi:hypothetical protein